MVAKRAGAADTAVQIVSAGSDEAGEIERIILKEVNKERYPPGKVVNKVNAAGFPRFRIQDHTDLWKELDAKKEGTGFGCVGDYGNWVWFDRWIEEVLKHCEAKGATYR